MDIFSSTVDTDSADLLEIDRFKAKIIDIWSRMLKECYSHYYDVEDEDSPSIDEFMEQNALKFANDPEPETELDTLMDMLDGLMDSDEELEGVKSEGKAPTYGGKQLTSHNESSKTEKTDYEYNHKSTKTPKESSSGVKGGSYDGATSSQISKRKDAQVITKYSPLVKEIKDELIALVDRQRIGRRKMRFRL
jgi:hypothetical protein|tara:strand:- start:391 stop:966 length:576 start_codon:yes stop_codon:yes gene_type:complete